MKNATELFPMQTYYEYASEQTRITIEIYQNLFTRSNVFEKNNFSRKSKIIMQWDLCLVGWLWGLVFFFWFF